MKRRKTLPAWAYSEQRDIIGPILSGIGACVSILQKVEKLILHEASARKLGSVLEADAFAAKAQQLLIEHKLERAHIRQLDGLQTRSIDVDCHRVTGDQAGIPALRTRQEWSERMAAGIAKAFHCELTLQRRSNTVFFHGREQDRQAAAQLYAELAQKASLACAEEFASWKNRRPARVSTGVSAAGAYSRRWKQSFLLGFARSICQRFVCDNSCLHRCQHATNLVRIGSAPQCPIKTMSSRAIGGMEVLYDALYRGQARAAAIVLDLDARCAA